VHEHTRGVVEAALGDEHGDAVAESASLSPDEAVALVLEDRVAMAHDLRSP
jgi:hypothetical protein